MADTAQSKQTHSGSFLHKGDSVRDATDRFVHEAKSSLNKASDQVSDMASETYEKATSWLQNNYGTAIGIVAGITVIGMFGYLLGKSSQSSSLNHRRAA